MQACSSRSPPVRSRVRDAVADATRRPLPRKTSGAATRGITGDAPQLQPSGCVRTVHVDVAGRLAAPRSTRTPQPNGGSSKLARIPLSRANDLGVCTRHHGQMRERYRAEGPGPPGLRKHRTPPRGPGLLEQTAGNQFRLRCIRFRQRTRRVRLGRRGAASRGGRRAARYPRANCSRRGRVSLPVSARGLRSAPAAPGRSDGLRFGGGEGGKPVQRDAFRASTPIGLAFRSRMRRGFATSTATGERYVLAEVPLIRGPRATHDAPSSAVVGCICIGAHVIVRRSSLARSYSLDGRGRVVRVSCVTSAKTVALKIRGGDWSALREALSRAVLDGASDLGDWTADPAVEEYLLVSDGLRTYGTKALPRLSPTQRLYAIDTAGAASDTVRLGKLAQQRNGRLVAWQGAQGVATHALLDEGVRIVGLAPHGVTDLEVPSRFIEDGGCASPGRVTDPYAYVDFTCPTRVRKTVRLRCRRRCDASASAWSGRAGRSRPVRGSGSESRGDRADRTAIRRGDARRASLLVRAVEDYVRFDIAPPPALREEVARLQAVQRTDRERTRSEHDRGVAAEFAARIDWWEQEVPEGMLRRRSPDAAGDAAPATSLVRLRPAAPSIRSMWSSAESTTVLSPKQLRPVARERADHAQARNAAAGAVERPASRPGRCSPTPSDAGRPPPSASNRGNPIPPTPADSAPRRPRRSMRRTSTTRQPRRQHRLLPRRRRPAARKGPSRRSPARAPTSPNCSSKTANPACARLLLMHAKDYARAVEVFRSVLTLADEEPQSHRDLGLALAATVQRQAASHTFTPWSRARGMRASRSGAVAPHELNAIAATSPIRSTRPSSTAACSATCHWSCASPCPGTATTATWTCGLPTPMARSATTRTSRPGRAG